MTGRLSALAQTEPGYRAAVEKAREVLLAKRDLVTQLTTHARHGESLTRRDDGASDRAATAAIHHAIDRLRDPPSTESADRSLLDRASEAVVQRSLRPAFYICKDAILTDAETADAEVRAILQAMELAFADASIFRDNQATLETAAKSCGLLALFGSDRPSAGTGWLIDNDVVVTNRHVAGLFARSRFVDDWTFKAGSFGRPVKVDFDELSQLDTDPDDTRVSSVTKILWVAASTEPDMAFLKLASPRAETLVLSPSDPAKDMPIGIVGYPARDLRKNDVQLVDKFFGTTFDVKRFAPGRIMSAGDSWSFSHDASTLGGNSGSAVLDLASGCVVGLHFDGFENSRNDAVPASVVYAALKRVRSATPVRLPTDGAPTEAPETPADTLANRDGYARDFLGVQLELPGFGTWRLAPLSDGTVELKYRNFSTFQERDRRLPLLTAANIDGARLVRAPFKGRYQFDGRIDRALQCGDALYADDALDQAQMVRRLDTGWDPAGDDGAIVEAQRDTYHYTNVAPHHSRLNQQHWLDLEDYLLDAGEDFAFRLCVLTGPIFRATDEPFSANSNVAIPQEYWKVAVMRHRQSGALSATGYVLSQGEFLRSMAESSFILGEYKTFQVPIANIAREARLDLADYVAHDPLHGAGGTGAGVREVRSADDLVLTAP